MTAKQIMRRRRKLLAYKIGEKKEENMVSSTRRYKS